MTALTQSYIDQIAEGHVPAKNSPERLAYEAEMTDGYDYTWAIQTFQAIKERIQNIWSTTCCGVCDRPGHDEQDCK